MITLNGKQYPSTKEFAEMTGISESMLWKIVAERPELTIKIGGFRVWDVERFTNEFLKNGFKSYKKKRRTGQLTKGN